VTYGLSYSDSPTTSDLTALHELPVNAPGTEPAPLPPDSGINRPGNPTRYVLRRADADISREMYRSTVSMNAWWEDRQDVSIPSTTADEATPLNDETSYGVNLNFRWELGPHTGTGLGADWTHREFADLTGCDPDVPGDCAGVTTDSDELYTLRARLDHELGLRTSLQFETGYQARGGTGGDEADYDEFWASAQVVRLFGRPSQRRVR
jgi:hypothetical protein